MFEVIDTHTCHAPLHYTCNINVHYDGAYEPTNDKKLQTFFPSPGNLSLSLFLSSVVFITMYNENVSFRERKKRELCEYPSKI